MRKIEFSLMVIGLLLLVLFVFVGFGCQEQLAESPQGLLVKPPTEWIEKYGDGLESQQTANIVLAIQVINHQGEAIKQLDKRLEALEDPNEVN